MFRRLSLVLLVLLAAVSAASSARANGVGNIGAEFFGPGTKAEMITLEQAIDMALRNNLDARFEHVGIALDEARRRAAVGEFDPQFTVSWVHESIRRPENANDLTATDQLLQVQQIQAITAETNAINQSLTTQNASTNAINAQTNAINAQTNAFRGTNLSTSLPTNLSTTSTTPLSTDTVNVGLTETIFASDNDRFDSGVQGHTPWGLRYGFEVQADRLRNTYSNNVNSVFPDYLTSATVTLIQPLLKNFGPAANLADVRLARLNKTQQVLVWKQRISTTVQSVFSTYYDMLYAMRDVDVKEDAIMADQKLVEQNRRRMDLGFMSPLDVQQAEVAVSTDREALLTAKGFFMERQFALKRLVLDELHSGDKRVFIPLNAPRLGVPKIVRPEFMKTALSRRYDYLASLIEADMQEIRLRFARNQLWPEVDLVGSYGLNGLQSSWNDSAFQALSDHTPSWSAGFQVQIPFGFVKERAQLNLARGLKEQALIKIKQTELNVGVDVDTVISRILTNQQRVDTAKKTRELNEEAVRVAYKRLEEGQISSFDVIEQQRKLYDAKSRELATIADLDKSISQLWLVTGTILDRQGIFFDK